MFVSIELHNKVMYEILLYIQFAVFMWKRCPVNQPRGAACHVLVFLRL